MPQLLLHIGLEKTGSTSIQSFLENHREKLAEDDILYPDTGKISNHHYYLASATSDMAALRDQLEDEARDFSRVIISSEHFSTFPEIEKLQNFRDLFRSFDVSVLAYMREPRSWLISLYAEYIKWGGSIGPNRYFEVSSWKFHYVSFVRKWTRVFGRNNLHLVNYHSHPDIVTHFAEHFLDGRIEPTGRVDANRSDPWLVLELARRISLGFPDVDTRELMAQFRTRLTEENIPVGPFAWGIRNVVETTLAEKQLEFNEFMGFDFFNPTPEAPIAKYPNQEERLYQLAKELLDLDLPGSHKDGIVDRLD